MATGVIGVSIFLALKRVVKENSIELKRVQEQRAEAIVNLKHSKKCKRATQINAPVRLIDKNILNGVCAR